MLWHSPQWNKIIEKYMKFLTKNNEKAKFKGRRRSGITYMILNFE